MNLFACDPGDTNGWALYIDDQLADFGQAKGMKELLKVINNLPTLDVIVVENYKILPHINHSYSTVPTIQIIGLLKAKALELDIKFVLEDPSIKPIAYKWSGLSKPKNHNASHEFDAIAIGYYYLVKAKRRQPILLERAQHGTNDSSRG